MLFKKIVLIIAVLGFAVNINLKAQSETDFETAKNMEIFNSLYKTIYTQYVDEISPADFMKSGIDAMLEKLDPYTVYIPESQIEDVRFMTTGEYGGIGSIIHKRDDKLYISEPYENSPAHKAGLKAGDVILSINGQSTKGKSVEDCSAILKGQPGTTLKIEVERINESKPITLDVIREKITINPVSYYGTIGNSIGYIKLNSFTNNAFSDLKKAFVEMRQKEKLNGLVIDLRDNGGGLLQEAVNIVSLFVKKGQLVVSTKGKLVEKNTSFRTTLDPIDTEIPLVVLVNGRSASASEIVSGALQDLDRAVIIGRRTFGKGLVQNIFPLKYNAQVKVTISKYYIPSNRCIQAIDYTHKNASGNPDFIPDSLITAYKTLNGRTVYDGKGIYPDILSDTALFSSVTYNLLAKNMIFDYATNYASKHNKIAEAGKFKLSDSDFNDFVDFTKKNNFEYKLVVENNMDEIKEAADYENYFDEIKSAYDQLTKSINEHKKNDIFKNKEQISEVLEQEIVSRYYFQAGRVVYNLNIDKDITKAIDVINNKSKYKEILTATK